MSGGMNPELVSGWRPEPVEDECTPDLAVGAAAASIRPISIDPESPMKMRALWKLCGRKPRHAPASTTEMTAGG